MENCCVSFFCDIENAEDDVLQKVNVRQNLSCQTPIEIPYYTIGHDPICYHCGGEESLDDDSKHLLICAACLASKRRVARNILSQKSECFYIIYGSS